MKPYAIETAHGLELTKAGIQRLRKDWRGWPPDQLCEIALHLQEADEGQHALEQTEPQVLAASLFGDDYTPNNYPAN